MSKAFVVLVVALLLASCNPKQEWQKRSIDNAEKALMEQAKKGKVDTAGVNALLKDYEAFADNYPRDTNGANYLFKAADFYRYMHKPLRSIELYAKVYDRYPAAAKRPYALFLQGFIYENEVGNPTAAKNLYEKFLAAYPTHAIAKDVRTTVENLGKTPEQLIQEFQQNAAQDSLAKVDR